MKTIKLPYKTSEDLLPILKQYSNVVRYSYNRFLDGKTEKDIRGFSKSMKSIDLLNSWVIQCAIREGKSIFSRFKDKKVIFGGKLNFVKKLKGEIDKEEFDLKRMSPITIQGEELQKGNRMFKLDIIENNRIVFKLNRTKHIELKLPNLRNNIKKDLFRLQQLNEVKDNQKGYTYSIRFDLNNIYISFEEFKQECSSLVDSRYLGIDLNPDTIGISILEDGEIIHAQEFSVKKIFDKITSEGNSSNSKRSKYLQNKLNFETFEISKNISLLAEKFNCKSVFIEDLKFKDSSKIKTVNRKNKNLWKRQLFVNNLTKRLNICGIKLYSVNPAYSSFIGNLTYDYTDAVNASIEIARRGYEFRIKKNKVGFFPSLMVKHQWKEMATKYVDWKKFYFEVKNLKLKYRVSLKDVKYSFNVFQQNSTSKSMVQRYVFYT